MRQERKSRRGDQEEEVKAGKRTGPFARHGDPAGASTPPPGSFPGRWVAPGGAAQNSPPRMHVCTHVHTHTLQ